jgi:hypothetical protein
MSTAPQGPTITVRGVKVNTLIPPQSLAADLVPAEPQPATRRSGSRSPTARSSWWRP